jgi:hypothetical protein
LKLDELEASRAQQALPATKSSGETRAATAAGASAARDAQGFAKAERLPGLWRWTETPRGRRFGNPGVCAGTFQSDPAGSAEAGLFALRQDRVSGSSEPSDRARDSRPGTSGSCVGLEILRPFAFVPLYRQAEIYARDGVELDRSTKPRWPSEGIGGYGAVRWPFFDLYAAHKSAKEALERIAALYAIEDEIRGRSAEERRKVRNERSRPLLESLKQWLEETLGKLSTKSDTTRAIHYALGRWEALLRYCDDGHLEIDNNSAERSLRAVVLGRKNYLFAGSDAGGERAAALYGLIGTAKLNGLNPEAYLREVLSRIADQPYCRTAAVEPRCGTHRQIKPRGINHYPTSIRPASDAYLSLSRCCKTKSPEHPLGCPRLFLN